MTLKGTLTRIEQLVQGGRGGCVFTPNVDHVVVAQDDPAFKDAYAAADLCLPDGVPLVWSSRLLGAPLPGKVSGSDLAVPLIRRAATLGWRTYLLGGQPGVPEAAHRRLASSFPEWKVVGMNSPSVNTWPPDPDGDAAIERVRSAKPDLVLVAFGAPKQELWIHRNIDRIRPAVAVGVGATLDFLAGRLRRAPHWVSTRIGVVCGASGMNRAACGAGTCCAIPGSLPYCSVSCGLTGRIRPVVEDELDELVSASSRSRMKFETIDFTEPDECYGAEEERTGAG